MEIWKQRNGSHATYNNLIGLFELARHLDYADTVRNIIGKNKPHYENDLYSVYNNYGKVSTDKSLIFQSTNKGVGDPQTMSLECATTGGKLLVNNTISQEKSQNVSSTIIYCMLFPNAVLLRLSV